MSERGRGKSRKSPAAKASPARAPAAKPIASKAPAKRAAKTSKGSSATTGKSTARRAAAGATTVPLDAPSLMARVVRLENEREQLQAALAKAEARIRELQESREEVVNRIDWVIDSLRSLVDD